MKEPLITKYRPLSFEEYVGNQLAISSLRTAINSETRPHCYLFTGPSGVGKTTLARIIAKEFNATIYDVDGASNSGVDDTRRLVAMAGYTPIIGSAVLYIIDECHALSKLAWDPLLKLLEEPPEYLYVALCTTELAKVKETIRNRCFPVNLKKLKPIEISDLLTTVCEVEQWKVNGDVFNAIVLASEGSARKALTILQAGHNVQTREELSTIILEVESDNTAIIDLCKLLLSGNTNWERITELLKLVEDEEQAIEHACSYLAKVMVNVNDEKGHRVYHLLDCLTTPRASWDKKIQLYAGIGKYFFA